MDPHQLPARVDSVKWQVIDEEGILVHLETGYYFSLNAVGLFIWDHCDGQHDYDAILRGILEEFDVEESIARGDLDRFLSELVTEKLLILDTPPLDDAS